MSRASRKGAGPRAGRVPTRWLVGLGLVAAVLVGPGGPAAQADEVDGAVGIRLLDAPTDRADDPRARTYIVDHLEPGATVSRRVEVVNRGAGATDVAVYVGGATIDDGRMQFAAGREGDELTEWATVDRDAVALEAGAAAEVTVTIDVPADAPPGEHYGVVWAEVASAPPQPGQVGAVSRVGVRIYLSVGGDNEPASDFTISTLEARRDDEGRALVEATVDNTGGRALDLTGELTLSDGPGGLSAGPFPTEDATTLGVGQSGVVVVALDDAIPAGQWTADLVVRSGRLEKEASATITIPEAAGTSGGAVEPDDDGFPWLVVVGVAIAALLAAVVAVVLWRHRRPGEEEVPA